MLFCLLSFTKAYGYNNYYPRNYDYYDGYYYCYEYYIDIPKWERDVPLNYTLQKYTYDTCSEYDIDYDTVLGVIKLESDFDAECVSLNKDNNGNVLSKDEGLMQINSFHTHWYAELAGLEKYDSLDPYDSIKMGIAGLAFYRDYWEGEGIEEPELTIYMLNSYNMGIGGYRSYLKRSENISRSYDRVARSWQDE